MNTQELDVQRWLRTSNLSPKEALSQLNIVFDIRLTYHPSEPLVILNYGLESPKTLALSRECRGLTLDYEDNFRVVAKGFTRFFNYGEALAETQGFDWKNFCCTSKEDGSILLIFKYKNLWRVNTRGSFGCGIPNELHGRTWEELFYDVVDEIALDEIKDNVTLVCELVSPYTKVVRQYPKTDVYLLSMFDNDTLEEYQEILDIVAQRLRLNRPQKYSFKNIKEIQSFCENHPEATYEGVVVFDGVERLKIKNSRYLSLHHLRGEGQNLYSVKNLISFILSGDTEELLCYFPEVKTKLDEYTTKIDTAYLQLMKVWNEAESIASQKEFAQFILPKTPLASILFEARKRGVSPASIWRDNAPVILKRIFNQ